MTPAPGSRAPAFTLPDQDGNRVSLRDFAGRRVVLYFYPRDDTSGCTTEACEFRSQWKRVEAEGAVILGVSPDSPASHAKFRRKYRLPFTLLADEKHMVATKYGVWARKSLYGRSYMGILRPTSVSIADPVRTYILQPSIDLQKDACILHVHPVQNESNNPDSVCISPQACDN